jgi:restriction system protein
MTKAKALWARLREVAGAILWPILRDEASRPDADPAVDIRAMKWPNVQLLIAEAFRLDGFLVKEIGGESADMVLVKDERTYLVDCRHWRALEVGDKPLAALRRDGAPGRRRVRRDRRQVHPRRWNSRAELNVELIGGRELARKLEMAKETISGALPVRPLAR